MSGLGHRYSVCKQNCLNNNENLAKEIHLREMNEKKSSELFHPMSVDPCMKGCRNTYYLIFKRVNKYLVNDRGFYVEGVFDID